jgi:DNA-binding NtrC family response regulator
LRNVIERALILETSPEIQAANLPDFQLETRLTKNPTAPLVANGERSLDEMVADFERELITTTLAGNANNLTKTAEQLKISRHALRYRMQRLNQTTGEDDPAAKETSPS